MPSYSFKMPRLYLDAPLATGAEIALEKSQANYLVNVLRLGAGDEILAFNGRDGEWLARLAAATKRQAVLTLASRTREQTPPARIDYLFAPLKHARLDYMVQKAVEMGAGRLTPVLTEHTQVTRVNTERMRANVIEACEQCGVLSVPGVGEPEKLPARLDRWSAETPLSPLLFCDERFDGLDTAESLASIARWCAEATDERPSSQSVGLLIGPEGGFSPRERELLLSLRYVHVLPLGPRILRADTAAVAALAAIQTFLGDWRDGSRRCG